ncbi:MFS-type transporter SLC18B1-like [Tachypleus tridentatus]|uniref:MFS-type transporter SLC18B1-like n=1 Tax=Tachypleus tridentatus TaxID=6853 RepID=UPI003FD04C94
MLCVILNVVADAFILITLSDHLQQFSLHPLEIGCIYLCLFLSYSFSSPIAGKLADKLKLEYILQCIGSLILVVAFALIGPLAFFSLSPCVWLVTAGLLLKGLGAGPLISCSYSACLRFARQKGGFLEDFRTYSLVSSIISFCIPLGNLIGGFSAGVMLENLGMSWSTTVLAFVFTGLAICCLVAHFLDKVTFPLKRPMEHTPLYTYQKDKTLYSGKTTLLPGMIIDSETSNNQNEDELSDETSREAVSQLFNTILKSQSVY